MAVARTSYNFWEISKSTLVSSLNKRLEQKLKKGLESSHSTTMFQPNEIKHIVIVRDGRAGKRKSL